MTEDPKPPLEIQQKFVILKLNIGEAESVDNEIEEATAEVKEVGMMVMVEASIIGIHQKIVKADVVLIDFPISEDDLDLSVMNLEEVMVEIHVKFVNVHVKSYSSSPLAILIILLSSLIAFCLDLSLPLRRSVWLIYFVGFTQASVWDGLRPQQKDNIN